MNRLGYDAKYDKNDLKTTLFVFSSIYRYIFFSLMECSSRFAKSLVYFVSKGSESVQ